MIAVVDYDMGNVGSILNMLRKLGAPARLTNNGAELMNASGIILPGVGAFDTGMQSLWDRELVEPLRKATLDIQIPTIGICLGMQLLTHGSDEGNLPGLGLINAHTRRFSFSPPGALRVPHMGWTNVQPLRPTTADSQDLSAGLFAGTEADQRYYFVHSFHVCCGNRADVIATASYGHEFDAAIGVGNIVGTQFHPEKSHRFGLRLMQNFAEYCVRRQGGTK